MPSGVQNGNCMLRAINYWFEMRVKQACSHYRIYIAMANEQNPLGCE